MKKQYSILAMAMASMLLMTSGVLALDLDATKWNIRGSIGLEDVDNYFGVNQTYARGRYNAHINLQRGDSGSGHMYVQTRDIDGERHRLSLRWTSRTLRGCAGHGWWSRTCGTYGGMNVTTDTDEMTVFSTNARMINDGVVEYGVPITVTYMIETGELTVEADNEDFKFVI